MQLPKFKTPFLNGKRPSMNEDRVPEQMSSPACKKIKLEKDYSPMARRKSISGGLRKPLGSINRTPIAIRSSEQSPSPIETEPVQFNVLWRKPTTKKHKSWDGDAVLTIRGTAAIMKDAKGHELGRGVCKVMPSEGDLLHIGGKEVEVEGQISTSSSSLNSSPATPIAAFKPKGSLSSLSRLVSDTTATMASIRMPSLGITTPRKPPAAPKPRHPIDAPNAVIFSKTAPMNGKQATVDVVLDPLLAEKMRPHQQLGVEFLYECVMGIRNPNKYGAILADDMGLGKTLQTIALIWTLLKQSPYGALPIIKKALVVCPVTLINNWKREFRKWLGPERISVFVADDPARIRDFNVANVWNVMIIGYEKLRMVQDDLKDFELDLIVCDEGHRLKTAGNKVAQAIRKFNNTKRIILSGTPIQNDLGEFYEMADFVCPGILGTLNEFKKTYESPMLRSRQPHCLASIKELGQQRSQELAELAKTFVLRRESGILSGYLPPKLEVVVFCQPTQLQVDLYHKMLQSAALQQLINTDREQLSPQHLSCIIALKKLCNTPGLLRDIDAAKLEDPESIYHDFHAIRTIRDVNEVTLSGKMQVLFRLLEQIYNHTKEKVVLVSNYTQTLDILEAICEQRSWGLLRLDGSTPPAKRQTLVDRFNTSGRDIFIFLLSTKSGGTGLNLIGASRLVLFDVDWNPSNDAQAMARIHRDGQKQPVVIYRLLTTGTIDEKIFQRQLSKQDLSNSLIGSDKDKGGVDSFSTAELRDLYTLHTDILCQTHDLLECDCGDEDAKVLKSSQDAMDEEDGPASDLSTGFMKASQVSDPDVIAEQSRRKRNKAKLEALHQWTHVACKGRAGATHIEDAMLQRAIEGNSLVSFVFSKKSV